MGSRKKYGDSTNHKGGVMRYNGGFSKNMAMCIRQYADLPRDLPLDFRAFFLVQFQPINMIPKIQQKPKVAKPTIYGRSVGDGFYQSCLRHPEPWNPWKPWRFVDGGHHHAEGLGLLHVPLLSSVLGFGIPPLGGWLRDFLLVKINHLIVWIHPESKLMFTRRIINDYPYCS